MPPSKPAKTLPLVAEELTLEKRRRETARVRVRARVVEAEARIEEALLRESVEVERVAIGREVETPPAPRQEGDTLIIPVLEEILVVEKRLLLKEELRITRRSAQQPFAHSEPLRRHVVEATRHAAEPASGAEPKDDPSS